MKLLKHKQVWRVLVLLVLDILLFTTTNAGTAPSFVAIAAFVLLVATVYQLIYLLIGLSKFYGLPVRHKRPLAAYLTGVVGVIVALQSIGELGPRDVVVILPLAFVGYLYSAYAKAGRSNLET
jgi:uncharacterized membrane protein